jgi:hypothetical protein
MINQGCSMRIQHSEMEAQGAKWKKTNQDGMMKLRQSETDEQCAKPKKTNQ